MKEKGLSQEHSRILSYRIIQLQKMRKQGFSRNSARMILREVKNSAETCVENMDLPDLDEKKEKLV